MTPTFEHHAVHVGTGVETRHAPERAVRIDEEGIFVGGALRCRRAAIGTVTLRVTEQSFLVDVRGPGLPLIFKLPEIADARRMLEALGVEPARAHTIVEIAPQLDLIDLRSSRTLGPLALSLGLAALFTYLIGPYVLVMLAAGMTLLANASTLLGLGASLDIGLDGVRVQWLRIARFISYAAMDRVTHDGTDTIAFALRSGETVRVRTSAAGRVADIVQRIEASVASLASTPKVAEAPALRVRVKDAVSVAELRRLGAMGEGDYRVVGLDRDHLWEVLEDPANAATTRANAAAALSGHLDAADRRRLRVAAAATASPYVRVAIEKAATSASDEELAEALARVDEA